LYFYFKFKNKWWRDKKDFILELFQKFEAARCVLEGTECLSARELQKKCWLGIKKFSK